VIERLNYFLEITGQISSLQFGFTAGISTADAIKSISDFVGNSRKREIKCCLLALDIAWAFDNAWHPGILARLREIMSSKQVQHGERLRMRQHCPRHVRNLPQQKTGHQKLFPSNGLRTDLMVYYYY
jgi:hypothetical protein